MSRNVGRSQQGMVSIMVTLIMMIVISLIVLGFAQVARTNQRETLNRELSTQAFYAAETGINDAVSAIQNGSITLGATDYHDNCSTFIGALAGHGVSNTLDSSNGTAYTCLLVNNQPKSVVTNIALNSPSILPLNMNNSSGSLTFTWSSNSNHSSIASCPSSGLTAAFSPNTATGWDTCPYGILKVDIYHDDGNYNPATMMASSIYLVPTNGSGTGAAVAAGSPLVVRNSHCTTSVCTATVSGFAAGTASYYARLSSIYESSGNVTITSGPTTTFANAQLEVDSTGKAQDELRRIDARIPLTNQAGISLPTDALESADGICKRFSIIPGGSATATGGDTTLCDQPTSE